MDDFVLRFASSPERCAILDGFLRYRSALAQFGLVNGFQWLDGSFLEDIENRDGRPPRDLDVVTFIEMPDADRQQEIMSQAPAIFPARKEDRDACKDNFHIDSFFVNLNRDKQYLVERAHYWYSVWAHTRDKLWKGFVQIPLEGGEDEDARIILEEKVETEGWA